MKTKTSRTSFSSAQRAALLKTLEARFEAHASYCPASSRVGGLGAVSRSAAHAALHEMLFSGGVLNKRLLGGADVSAP